MTIHWEALAWMVFAGLALWFVVLPLVALLIAFGAFFQEVKEEENDEAP